MATSTPPLNATDEEFLRNHLQTAMGFNLENVDLGRLLANLALHEQEFESFEDYASAVASLIAVHETYFLRHPDQFVWLTQYWLPEWLAKHPQSSRPLRILSAGCATGEEPYSLVAHLQPLLAQAGRQLVVEGIDVSQKALATAQRGHYGLWSLRGVDVDREQQWLHVGARSIEVMDWVRLAVQFRHHNLTTPLTTTSPYDLILCRNVLIYMHDSAINQILQNLANCLAVDGILLPGPSDPNPPISSGLQAQWCQGVRVLQHTDSNAVLPDKVQPLYQTNIPQQDFRQATPTFLPTTSKSCIPSLQDYAAIEALIHAGYYNQARELLEVRLTANSFDVRSHVMLTLLSLDLDDLDTAWRAARNASFLEPDAIFPVYLLANIRLRHGDSEGARAEAMWVYQQLKQCSAEQPVRYCEEITVGQLKEVVSAGL